MAGDFNFYRYVGNDPVNRSDPSGLIACGGLCIALIAIIAKVAPKIPKIIKVAPKVAKEALKQGKKGLNVAKKKIQKAKCAIIKGLKTKACSNVGLKKTGSPKPARLKTMKNYVARNNFDNITCLSIHIATFATEMCIKYRRMMTVLVRKKKCSGSPKKNAAKTHKDAISEQKKRLEVLKDIKKGKGC